MTTLHYYILIYMIISVLIFIGLYINFRDESKNKVVDKLCNSVLEILIISIFWPILLFI